VRTWQGVFCALVSCAIEAGHRHFVKKNTPLLCYGHDWSIFHVRSPFTTTNTRKPHSHPNYLSNLSVGYSTDMSVECCADMLVGCSTDMLRECSNDMTVESCTDMSVGFYRHVNRMFYQHASRMFQTSQPPSTEKHIMLTYKKKGC
jgi:hypothetical protein